MRAQQVFFGWAPPPKGAHYETGYENMGYPPKCRHMTGKGIDLGEVGDLQGYGEVATAVAGSVDNLVNKGDVLMDSGAKNINKLAAAAAERKQKRIDRLKEAGRETGEEANARRREAKITRQADNKDRRTEVKTQIKEAKAQRKIDRINRR